MDERVSLYFYLFYFIHFVFHSDVVSRIDILSFVSGCSGVGGGKEWDDSRDDGRTETGCDGAVNG